MIKINKNLILILILPFCILFSYLASFYPYAIEKCFSQSINKAFIQFSSNISGLFPFSLAEVILILSIFYIIINIIGFIRFLLTSQSCTRLILKKKIYCLLVVLGFIYFLFIFMWGLNYYRIPFSQISGLEVHPTSLEELEQLCKNLIIRTNELRAKIRHDKVYEINSSYKDIFNRSDLGYNKISQCISELGGKYGKPKAVMLSELMCYAGISGIYSPFTSEANVNKLIPVSMLPSTICHEMAHQRGFAREDEANFISYLACINHPDLDFQYSGNLLALIYSMNALAKYDINRYTIIIRNLNKEVINDLTELNNFWSKYEGPVEKASNKMNNAYLKANQQPDGVKSYGRMVDLLLAEQRKLKTKF